MKIAFIGTHGVGKTTLCFDLAACLKRLDVGVDIVKEVARHCPLPINRDTTSDAQEWILHTQVAQEIALSHAYRAVVCDRSVLDNYAYMVHAVGRRPDLEPFLGYWVKTYTLLVRVPIIGTPAFDGTRDTSPGFQREVDDLITRLLQEFKVNRLELDPGNRDGWIGQVLEAAGLPRIDPQLGLFNGFAGPD